eukprot:CAMPEP_0176338530 /NCGR_PEP_ID=MMETSP0126-20121128/37_1 /TAXON_ID=141414 ORGANISM="Strombidinopsis acuminatum, Strain SPMC142" /NCGR_SAMPLE_ID=MMETSP0126 /ASSEMBLY_ACC=CAM_ASM_000229 /LENGTH=82 /DNA_ID=CAMNT_0017681573 /DNA_START=286 /DNA_END=534 /DNA_ORIENTATION=-
MTNGLFYCDSVKNLILSIIGYLALAPIVVAVFSVEEWYMLAVIAGVATTLMCLMSILYPCMVEECFNTFKELPKDHPMHDKI